MVRALLFLAALPIYGQSITYTVTATFANHTDTCVTNTTGGSYTFQYMPPASAQTLTPTTTDFVYGSYGKVVITRNGSPIGLPLNSCPLDSFQITATATGHTGSIPYAIERYGNNSATNETIATIDGVHFSHTTNELPATYGDKAPPSQTIDIVSRLTRGQTVILDPLVTITTTAGIDGIATFRVQTVGNLPILSHLVLDQIGVGPGSQPGIGRFQTIAYAVSPQPVWVHAPGVPPAFMQVQVIVNPFVPNTLTVSPLSVTFSYTRGGPSPAPVILTVTSAQYGTVQRSNYDSGWIQVNPYAYLNNGGETTTFTIIPDMTSKPAGSHTTSIRITANDAVVNIPVTFYVADSAGQINLSTQPYAGGSVDPPANVQNGVSTQLTARPAPGFQFTRWTGAINSTTNPVTFVVNGIMNITAEFALTNGCTFTFTPTSAVASPHGDVGRIDISTGANCPWTLSQTPSWITAAGSTSGTGPGALSYVAQPNPSVSARQNPLVINGYAVNIAQSGANCLSLTTPAPSSIGPNGGTLPVLGPISDGCTLVTSVTDNWLSLIAPTPFNGFTTYTASAPPNLDQAPRTSAVNINGLRYPILQKTADYTSVFNDVPATHTFADYINVLERAGIADLCPAGFCPELPTTRAQMAEFLVHSILRTTSFTYPTTPIFTDVPATDPRFKWIQKLNELGITTGCGAGKFCPNDTVTRSQMAALIIRTRARISASTTFPVRNTAFFTDVPSGNVYFPFVQKLRDWGITAGCDATKFCPDEVISRGQMAVFLVRGLLTP